MSPETTVLVIVILVAVLLDAALISWLRRTRRLQKMEGRIGQYFLTFIARLSLSRLRLSAKHVFEPRPVSAAAGAAFDPQDTDEISAPLPSPGAARPAAQEIGSNETISSFHWLEWGLIALAITLFCTGFLDLAAPTSLPGNESEVFQTLDWTLINSLRYDGQFPLWNPYIRTGIPFIADPMLHVFNPVATLPVLLFGVRAGFKLAVFFSFLIAAFGMWRLAAELGFKAPTRLWTAFMYAFAGQPLAHFFQGQYLFVLGYAWIPWIVAGLFLTARTHRRRHAALTVMALGLLFFSGNTYYAFYMALVALLFAIVRLPRFQKSRPWIRIDGGLLAILGVIAILSLGLVAIQLLPEAQFWPRIRKDMNVVGSHTLAQIFLDYTSKDASRPDAYSQLPAREEFYAYIGLSPFLALPLLALAWKRGSKRTIVFLLLIVMLVIAWVTLDRMPWRDVFLSLPLLRQFRHLLRILVLGSFAFILLAGIGLDQLWRETARPIPASDLKQQPRLARLASMIGPTLVIVFAVVSLVDLWQTNAPITRSIDIHQPAYAVMNWLRQFDPSEYYVRHLPSNSWADATIAADLNYIEAWYHFADIRNSNGQINRRPVVASPKYIIQASGEPAPTGSEIQLVHQMLDTSIYRDLQSLPMVFKLPRSALDQEADKDPLTIAEVTPLENASFSPNRVRIAAKAAKGEVLVVLTTHDPDWTVAIDGQPAELEKVGGYLAVSLLPGEHEVTFSFRPRAFWVGLVISLLAASVTLVLLFRDIDLSRENVRWKVHQAAAGFGQLKRELGRGISTALAWLNLENSTEMPPETTIVESVTSGQAAPQGLSLRAALRGWLEATNELLAALTRTISITAILWTSVLGVYLITRLAGLTQFPIYFFTDEAAQTILAGDLVRDQFKNYAGDFLPTYFENGGHYRLGVSVYAQVIPYLMFGKSIAVTRATSVVITLLGVAALGLILRNHFRVRLWWVGVLLLSLAPAWFLHSRTAFETAEAVSFFAVFIFFYLEYRSGRLNRLYLALIAGALAFYTYSPFQVIMALCGLLLLLFDWRYHWRNRAMVGRGLLLACLLAIPYLRFVLTRGQANLGTLAALGSVWVRPVPLSEKIFTFFREYFQGLSPAYWFWPQTGRLIRHEMKGYAYLPWPYLPLIGMGFVISFVSFYHHWRGTGDEQKAAAFRTIWICLLVIPFSAALVEVGITRLLALVIPAVLFAAIGLDWLFAWITGRGVPARALTLGIFVALAGLNFWMLRDALSHGPIWYNDYGMSGLQYGTRQIFPAVEQYLQENPGSRVVISPTWANGTDLLARFMLPESLPVELGSITGYMDQHKNLDQSTLFVLPPDEYRLAVESGKFTGMQVVQTIPYPNGEPGFYFLKLNYVSDIDRILAGEREQRHQLVEDDIDLDGQKVHVRYSRLDMGAISALFDHNPSSVARTLEANPYVVELTFPEPRSISGLSLIIGSSEVEVTALRYTSPDGDPDRQIARFKGSVERPEVSWDFDRLLETSVLRLEVKDIHQTEPAHVHLWEIKLR